ncbi:hypothetical protein QTP86_018551 [Hemibagrus guttatus]|nr:hypothetical protein QTP86_018551 [Hemibagrus guttatus]
MGLIAVYGPYVCIEGIMCIELCMGLIAVYGPYVCIEEYNVYRAVYGSYVCIEFWIIPSIVGSSMLYFLSDDKWESITAWLYGTGLSGLFIMSTMFHTVSWKKSHLQTVEQRFHMCDRMVIYFFIAASYAPWLNLRELGPWAAHMRWLVWIMACVGSAYVFFFHEKNKILDLICYTVMGAVPAFVLLSMPNREGVLELSMGGVFYCLGVVFFKSDGLVPFAHAIWHVFVAVGAAIHYYAIWKYLYATGSSHMR